MLLNKNALHFRTRMVIIQCIILSHSIIFPSCFVGVSLDSRCGVLRGQQVRPGMARNRTMGTVVGRTTLVGDGACGALLFLSDVSFMDSAREVWVVSLAFSGSEDLPCQYGCQGFWGVSMSTSS